jgi:hypothetical protein
VSVRSASGEVVGVGYCSIQLGTLQRQPSS